MTGIRLTTSEHQSRIEHYQFEQKQDTGNRFYYYNGKKYQVSLFAHGFYTLYKYWLLSGGFFASILWYSYHLPIIEGYLLLWLFACLVSGYFLRGICLWVFTGVTRSCTLT